MYDFVFAGGGLASCLTALRLVERCPDLRVVVVEAEATLGGNHTWSFFPTDLTAAELAWVAPLIQNRWSCYDVRFPGFARRLSTGYCSMHSAHFHEVMSRGLGGRVRLAAPVRELSENAVLLESGERIEARCVVDGRGPQPSPHLCLGFQKFTGQVLELESPHGLEGPIIMDATVPQLGDYRFVYTLPLAERRLLVEDTRYSDSPVLDARADARSIEAYALAQGFRIARVSREERGALPITLAGDIDGFWRASGGIPRIGLRAALFHATTGYSFADAVRTAGAIADNVAAGRIATTPEMFAFLRVRSIAHWRRQAYWRLLNRMLFIAAEPDRRHEVMRRFYGLRQPLIERFYAGRSGWLDKARILTGKPPVAILAALRSMPEASAFRHTGATARPREADGAGHRPE